MHNNPITIREALQRASSFLSTAGVQEPMFIAEYLIRSYLGWDRARFVLQLSTQLNPPDWQGMERWFERAACGEPIQYIVGVQEFYGEDFIVAPGVLIPRPETELLIDHILAYSNQLGYTNKHIRVIDLGTGSGIIATTLARLRPHWQIYALDLSQDALTIATKNAQRLGVGDRIQFIQGSMLNVRAAMASAGIAEEQGRYFDLIVSNPPYIPSGDIVDLQTEVKDHEPTMALDGGADGLDFYRGIAEQIPQLLKVNGLVAFEVGIGQGEAISMLLSKAGAKQADIHLDFQQIDRIVVATF